MATATTSDSIKTPFRGYNISRLVQVMATATTSDSIKTPFRDYNISRLVKLWLQLLLVTVLRPHLETIIYQDWAAVMS